MSGLTRLDERREQAFEKLAIKLSESTRFASWFPLRNCQRQGLRRTEKYQVKSASTQRYYKSPLNMMRRKLNETASGQN